MAGAETKRWLQIEISAASAQWQPGWHQSARMRGEENSSAYTWHNKRIAAGHTGISPGVQHAKPDLAQVLLLPVSWH
jgi:hypothetical protein